MIDLLLAIAHHILIFGVFGALISEHTLLRAEITAEKIKLLGGIDRGYGLMAVMIIMVGVGRVMFGRSGPDYYTHNLFFWAKMVAFLAVGICSILPTRAFVGWQKAPPDAAAVAKVMRWIRIQLALFVLIPVFAAIMARGYGQL
ncbi:DUF2214 family protein [Asticcacaulis sp. AC402]|uniref:DUF2214 family protein n=1 Tax=Asticcacaulis sp. AC402 TaxID=1282361 RepID=UPI0003C3ED92|nr:DUF2214 family protein [Asticcacaulis sp. AC402]ESQ74107.1 hypothetical protein ABAC402_15765 [Asticcacaulis sp. AC402]